MNIRINVKDMKLTTSFLASTNIDEVILGRDWLFDNKVNWYFAQDTIFIHGRKIKLR